MIRSNWWMFLIGIMSVHVTSAQDIHWSQFNDNPLNQNPGNTGNYNGDYRFVGNYRTQWKSVTVPFETIAISAEKRIDEVPGLAAGLQFFNDVAGDGQFSTNEFIANLAYAQSLPFGIAARPGIALGINQRRFDPTKFFFDNQFDGLSFNPALATGENIGADQKTNLTIGLGSTFSKSTGEQEFISGGLAIFNINRPNQGFYNQKVKRDRRININALYQYPLNKSLFIIPSVQMNFQGKYREAIAGGNAKYILKDNRGDFQAAQAGLWYRFGDAAYLTVGGYYQDFFFGISYDINLSKLTVASKARGGIEFAVRYILRVYKAPKKNHRICPEFI